MVIGRVGLYDIIGFIFEICCVIDGVNSIGVYIGKFFNGLVVFFCKYLIIYLIILFMCVFF